MNATTSEFTVICSVLHQYIPCLSTRIYNNQDGSNFEITTSHNLVIIYQCIYTWDINFQKIIRYSRTATSIFKMSFS